MIIDRGVDIKEATEKIVTGASFDNGIICSHEQFVLAPAELYKDVVVSFQATGKVWFTEDEAIVQKFRDLVFPGGHLNKNVVGRSCREIGAMIGVDVPASARIILLPAHGAGTEDVLAKEKLCPVVAILPYQDFQEAVAKAKANLLVEGAGHSAAVHSNDEAHIRNAGLELPISRLVVNQVSSLTAGGSLSNGFAPDHDARLRLVGRQLDLGEPGLQAPDERVAHRQGDHRTRRCRPTPKSGPDYNFVMGSGVIS